jgi:hypothetical protein
VIERISFAPATKDSAPRDENRLDMILDAARDTSEAGMIAFQVCSVLRIPLHPPWTVRFYLVDGQKLTKGKRMTADVKLIAL